MDLEHIIFDLGGVVVEWDPQAILDDFTQDPDLKAVLMREVYQHPDWDEKDRGALPGEMLEKRFCERTGLAPDRMRDLMRRSRDSLLLKNETVGWIRELKTAGYKLYCLSNMPADHEADLRARYDFWDLFDGVLTSHMVGLVKPEAGIYRHLLERFELAPEACLFIDDKQENIEAAEQLGIRGIRFAETEEARQLFREHTQKK